MMMKIAKISIFLMLAGVLGACVPSLNPLFTDKDVIFDTNLLGSWQGAENETWLFEADESNSYKLTHLDENKKAVFNVHLAKIKDLTFLDIFPSELGSVNYLYEMNMFRSHTFFKVEIENKQVQLQMLDFDLIKEKNKAKPLGVTHVKSQDGRILLTASTEELQKFVVSNVDLFGEKLILKKKK